MSILASLPLHKVERRHAADYLAEITTRNGPIAANRARAALSALFTWAMREGFVETNPVVGTNRAVPERSRERVLSEALSRSGACCAHLGGIAGLHAPALVLWLPLSA